MNFLAHLYLSGDQPDIMLGNFLGEFVKGRRWENFAPDVARGIRLHREIDRFTDAHPLVRTGIQRLRARHGRLSGVVVDMFYDHLLASNWSVYHAQPLAGYAQAAYRLLHDAYDLLPADARYMLPYMSGHDWLTAYASHAGVQRALQGLGRRVPLTNRLGEAMEDFEQYREAWHGEFSAFLPAVQAHCQVFLDELDR